ncbi:MAG: methyltransferase domain-containing protein [Candidatus Altiarchaeota archaeon]
MVVKGKHPLEEYPDSAVKFSGIMGSDEQLAAAVDQSFASANMFSPNNPQIAEKEFVALASKDQYLKKIIIESFKLPQETVLAAYFAKRHMDELVGGVRVLTELSSHAPPPTPALTPKDREPVALHNYEPFLGNPEDAVSRGFEGTEYGQEVFAVLADLLNRRPSDKLLEVLFVGPGRGIEVYDLMRRFGDKLKFTLLANENLLANPDYLHLRSKSYVMSDSSGKISPNLNYGPENFPPLNLGQFPLTSPDEAKKYTDAMREGLKIGNFEDMFFPDSSFDFVVFGKSTVLYCDDLNSVFNEAKRVLRPDGSALIPLIDIIGVGKALGHHALPRVKKMCDNYSDCSMMEHSLKITNNSPDKLVLRWI